MNVGRFPSLEEFLRFQRFLEARLQAQEARGESPNLLNDAAARDALAKYELFKKRPLLYVPQRHQRKGSDG